MFRRFFEEGLAQSSYLIACDRTRQAAVIDPRRDVAPYVELARAEDLTITHAIDTHIHADFVSGARELAALGATIVAGPGADLQYPAIEAVHESAIRLGDVELRALHTPGHTPEHISILETGPAGPARVFTGDTLFVGAVGRPDLLGDAVMLSLAGQLHDSLFSTLLRLPDAVEVWPGHGAGSLCGAGIGAAPQSTIGDERAHNPLLRHTSREAFVAAVLGDLPDTPPYFPRMKRVNREGAALRGLAGPAPAPPRLSPADTAAILQNGGWLLDLRPTADHAAGHPVGAIGIASTTRMGYWAAWVVPPDAPVVLLAVSQEQAVEARRQLLTVGLDTIAGTLDGGFGGWAQAGLPIARTPLVHPGETGGATILDVRSDHEWADGHIPGALHVPLQALVAHAGGIASGQPIATICESGARAMLAAGLLQRAGVERVRTVAGGMAAWRAFETPAV